MSEKTLLLQGLRLKESSMVLTDITCDFCGDVKSDLIVDAPTRPGPWAHMCPACAIRYARGGLGTVHEHVHKETTT